MEQRGTHTVTRLTETPPTLRGGISATTGVERIASRAYSHPEESFTALMHHYTVANLRACFESLDGKKALSKLAKGCMKRLVREIRRQASVGGRLAMV